MAIPSTLFLHHEIVLLALHEKRGTIAGGTRYRYAIGGAVLAELLLNKRIAVQPSGRKHLVEAVSAEPLGEPLVDRCLERINSERRRLSLQTLISRVADVKNLKDAVAQQLCKRNVLRAARGRILLIFRRKIYPQIDPEPKRELVERLRIAIFTDAMHVDPRTAILLSLADSTNVLSVVFDKKELSRRRTRIAEIVGGEIIGQAAREAIKTMQTAVVAP